MFLHYSVQGYCNPKILEAIINCFNEYYIIDKLTYALTALPREYRLFLLEFNLR